MFSGGARVRSDFDRLSARMERRFYPETLQALALYWLKTLWKKGYSHDDWNHLDGLLHDRLAVESRPDLRQAFADLRTWIRQAMVESSHLAHEPAPEPSETRRRPPDAETLRAYIVRLLSEWLPVEVARLMVEELERGEAPESGIPAVATARALERLLLRERLTPVTLEAMLEPALLSPRLVHPADYEILRDVALYLLGRVEALPAPVLPAALMFMAPDARLSSDYARVVEQAAFIADSGAELLVPIARADAMAALAGEQVRITSRIVTMDGQWWEAGELGGGEQNVIVYRPAGRIRINTSEDHASIRMPWPETRRSWTGIAHFGPPVTIFGREWRMGRWEEDADHTWVDLVFNRWLLPHELGLQPGPRRLAPAGVDLAWAALEDALLTCLKEQSADAIEKLRREEMIPLGRALLALIEAAKDAHMRQPAMLEARVRAVGFFAAAVRSSYGAVRWRVLPAGVRKTMLGQRLNGELSSALREVFDGVPEPPPAIAQQPAPARWLRKLAS